MRAAGTRPKGARPRCGGEESDADKAVDSCSAAKFRDTARAVKETVRMIRASELSGPPRSTASVPKKISAGHSRA